MGGGQFLVLSLVVLAILFLNLVSGVPASMGKIVEMFAGGKFQFLLWFLWFLILPLPYFSEAAKEKGGKTLETFRL